MIAAATAAFDRGRASALALRRAFDARARRERIVLICAAIAVTWMLGDRLWFASSLTEWSAARARRVGAVAASRNLDAEIARRGNEIRTQEQQVRTELEQARARVAQGDTALRAFGASLVGASDMVPMLEGLLVQVGGLHVRAMQSLGRSELGTTPAASASGAAGTLYRHGVEVTVEGSYAEVLAYLQAIEAMPQHVLWGGMQLKVDKHPKVVVTLRLYTLSADRNWLAL